MHQLRKPDEPIDSEYQLSYPGIGRKKIPKYLVGDQIRLKQVLVNLVKNAMKFSTRNTIKIKAAYDREAELLLVHVIDKGRGISETDKKKLFTLFGKLEATEEINSEGIGMGLVIC